MKRIILAVVLGLMFIAPANAIGPNDVLLSCWEDFDSKKELVTVILSPETNTVVMIDTRNIIRKGSLVVTDYFYTITMPKNTQVSTIGEIKINRFTGRISSQWLHPAPGVGKFSKAENFYGTCIKLPNNASRDF